MKLLSEIKPPFKGEIISKENYIVVNSSEKRTKHFSNSALASRAEISASFFLEELRISKFAFEII